MSEFKFRDYDVRVWGEDVFINSHNVIDYASGRSGALQINMCNDIMYEEIMDLCDGIAYRFDKLNILLDDIERMNQS